MYPEHPLVLAIKAGAAVLGAVLLWDTLQQIGDKIAAWWRRDQSR